ncbi:MAG TPA: arylamine N-acetyltransferase [Streptosporangiaceae bacterium]
MTACSYQSAADHPRSARAHLTDAVTAAPPAVRQETALRYLERLGMEHPGAPSVDALFALHRAHVARIPYEALDIQLRRPTSVDPQEAVARVLRGRGGYCVQLNTAFSGLLTALGYDVTWHRAGVQGSAAAPPSDASFAPHLALTVRVGGTRWLVDVGLGDALYEPLPLRAGTYRQEPLTFGLGPSRVEPGGWRFDHDRRGSIAGIDLNMDPATTADFAKWHPYLASSAESRLVRAVVVLRRDAAGADSLVGCMLRRVDGTGRTVRELATREEWYGALADVFGLSLAEVDATERAALWTKVRAAHEAWVAAKAAAAATPTLP